MKIVIFTLCAFLVATPLLADTIRLRNGKTYNGKIIAQNRTNIRIRVGNKTLKIPKKKILRVRYGDNTAALKKAELRKKRAAERRRKRQELRRKRLEERRKKQEARRLKKLEDKRKRAEARKQKAALLKKQKEERKRKALEKKNQKEADRKAALRRKQEQERKARQPQKSDSPWGDVWRSAVLPGWGQWRQDRKVTAGLYAGLTLAGVAGMASINSTWKAARADQGSLGFGLSPSPLQLTDPVLAWGYSQFFVQQQSAVDAHYANFQKAGIGLLVIYLWNVVDAYLFKPAAAKAGRDGFSKSKFAYQGRWNLDLALEPAANREYSSDSGTKVRFYFRQAIFR